MSQPILTASLFRPLHGELMTLLQALPAAAWTAHTSAGDWLVRDVVAHLLDVDLRRISVDRDAHPPPTPRHGISGYEDLTAWLDAMNAEWVTAARRLSPRLLTEMLGLTGTAVAGVMESADPLATATFPVAWAGDRTSPAWLDIGREYTERWHHQDQIRDAVGVRPLDQPVWLRPVIAISLRALPHAYAAVRRPAGTTVALDIDGPAGGAWSLTSDGARWRLDEGDPASWACRVRIGDLAVARLLLHRLPASLVAETLSVTGDAELAVPLHRARAVMVSLHSAGR